MSDGRLKEKAAVNIIWNFAGQGWLAILAFFSIPFIVGRLDVELYGIYILVGVVIDSLAFLQLGMGAASVKYIAQYLARGEEGNIRATFWTGVFSHFFLGTLGMVLIIGCAPLIVDRLFNVSSNLRDTALFALRLGSLGFLLSLMTGMVSGVIRAAARFDALNIMGIILGTMQIGFTVLVLILGFSLKEIVVASVAVQATGLLGYWFYAKRIMPFLRRPFWDGRIFLDLLKFGGFVTISGIAGPILTNIEKIFLTALRSVSEFTFYAVPFSLIKRLSMIPSSFSAVLFPLFSFYQETEDGRINRELHYRSTLYLLMLYALPLIFFLFYGREFLSLWIGEEFAVRSAEILIILGFAGMINAVAYPPSVGLQGMGKPQWPAAFHVLETFLYIPVGYLMIKVYGGVGAAFAWLFRVVLDTVLLQGAFCRLLGEPLVRWYGKLLYRAFPPLLLMVALFWGLKGMKLGLLHPLNIAGMLCVVALYGSYLWKWILDAPARTRLMALVKVK